MNFKRKCNSRLMWFFFGILVSFSFSMAYVAGLKKDFNMQILDFAEDRGYWDVPDIKKSDWPPHFQFRYFPAPKKADLTNDNSVI